jgi:hypothetical protein
MRNPQFCDSGRSNHLVGEAERDDLIAFGARAGTIFHQCGRTRSRGVSSRERLGQAWPALPES